MPRSPLPQRDGLDAAWIRTPSSGGWTLLRDHLVDRIPKLSPTRIDEMFAEGRWCDEQGDPLPADAPFVPNRFVWFHRDLPDEVEVPFAVDVLYRDDRIVVVDKPHFLAAIPRGNHVRQSVVVRMRQELDLPELSPAHRLDRVTAGVLLLTTRREFRAPYQQVFEYRRASKTYRVVAAADPTLRDPVTVRSHIVKDRGVWQAREVPDAEPNASTTIRLLDSDGDRGLYEAVPHTGKTHQIRLHFLRLGLPIINDPLYPTVSGWRLDDFSAPLQLLAHRLEFTDPLTDEPRIFTSHRRLAEAPSP
ncbi:tRNA pseudouridine32 synthase/23S rRNA pseudouridine746 synthase [Propioniferax innocua]|uniref:RNA pseudouridylate synthase n=2 Tax=Propioniferax innocua TaxID=1753 RepID=A0A542ZPU3_9ACTN|nr:tRNA pseudouridine32 synthase/23S rRNA pseudouridine746 synthase [Propioniferax innocua]